jgi:hypothetical protein
VIGLGSETNDINYTATQTHLLMSVWRVSDVIVLGSETNEINYTATQTPY